MKWTKLIKAEEETNNRVSDLTIKHLLEDYTLLQKKNWGFNRWFDIYTKSV